MFYAHGGFGGAPPNDGQRRFITHVDGFARLLEASARGSSRACPTPSSASRRTACAPSRPMNWRRWWRSPPAGPIHIHAAEQTGEVEDCVAWSGARPVQWLLDNAAVDARWCLVHATHMTDDGDRAAGAQRRGGGILPDHRGESRRRHRPRRRRTSRPAARSASARIRTCRSASREELRQLEYSQRLRDRARNVIGSRRQPFDRTRAVRRGGARRRAGARA